MWLRNSVGVGNNAAGVSGQSKRWLFTENVSVNDGNKIVPSEPKKTAEKLTVKLPKRTCTPAAPAASKQQKRSPNENVDVNGRHRVGRLRNGRQRLKRHRVRRSSAIPVPILATPKSFQVSPPCRHSIELPVDVIATGVSEEDPSSYSPDIIRNSKISEKELHFPADFADDCSGKGRRRAILVDWLIQVQGYLNMEPQTLHLAVQILDRYFMMTSVKRSEIQLVGITSLLIASKYEERFPPPIMEMIKLTDDTYVFDEMIGMERRILRRLQFALHIPTPMLYFKIGFDVIGRNSAKDDLATYLLDMALPYAHMVHCSASVQAASAIYLAHAALRDESQVSSDVCMRSLMYYLDCKEDDINDCVSKLFKLLQDSSKGKIQAARLKYLQQGDKDESEYNMTVEILTSFCKSERIT